MVNDPHAILGLPPAADDEAVRRKYLELARQFTPEQHPERFAQIRAAYEALKDVHTRLRRQVFERGRTETLDVLIGEVACRSPRRRVTLETLLQVIQARR